MSQDMYLHDGKNLYRYLTKLDGPEDGRRKLHALEDAKTGEVIKVPTKEFAGMTLIHTTEAAA